jgi:hypothetical protein
VGLFAKASVVMDGGKFHGAERIHADDTTVPVVGQRQDPTRVLWTYVRQPAVRWGRSASCGLLDLRGWLDLKPPRGRVRLLATPNQQISLMAAETSSSMPSRVQQFAL